MDTPIATWLLCGSYTDSVRTTLPMCSVPHSQVEPVGDSAPRTAWLGGPVEHADTGYQSRKIIKSRNNKFDTSNKQKFRLV